MNSKPNVKDLGRKAKARLEEELSRRHEIVRLDAEKVDPQARTERTSMKLPRSLLKRKKLIVSSSRQRVRRSSKVDSIDDISVEDVDRWSPATDHLPEFTDEDNRSNLVMVHGLPIDCTPDHLIRFFSGLQPQRIMILLSNSTVVKELDSRKDSRKRPRVERLPSCTRVCLKFRSTPAAALATQRSGELIQVGLQRTAISLSHVRKPLATFLHRYLAIDGEPKRALKETLINVELALPKDAACILWSEAFQSLQLEGAESSIDETSWCPSRLLDGDFDESQLKADRRELHARWTALCKELPFGCTDPELLQDPVIRIITLAEEVLQGRIDHIDSFLQSCCQRRRLHNKEAQFYIM